MRHPIRRMRARACQQPAASSQQRAASSEPARSAASGRADKKVPSPPAWLCTTAERVAKKGIRGLKKNKAIVLVSDGDDNQSHAYLTDAIKECQRAETIVYTISTNVSPSRDRGDDTLAKIAQATGGRAFYPKRLEDISLNFADIEDELRSQYALVYKPADFLANGAFRTIYLFCLDRKYTVRARQGYFAPRTQ